MINNKMKLGTAMVLIASLSVGLLTIPSKVAIAQTPPQNQTMPVNLTKSTSLVIPVDLNHLRDEVRSHHPLLAAIADQIQTMDVRDTRRSLDSEYDEGKERAKRKATYKLCSDEIMSKLL